MDSSSIENQRKIVNTVLYSYELPTNDFFRITRNMSDLPDFGPNFEVVQENFQVIKGPSYKVEKSLKEKLFSFIPNLYTYDRGKVNENDWNNDTNVSRNETGGTGNYTQTVLPNDYADEQDDTYIAGTQSSGFDIRNYLPL